MIGPIYSLRENGAQHGGRGSHLRLSTLQGSTFFKDNILAGQYSAS